MKGPDTVFLVEITRGKVHTLDSSSLESPKSSRGERVGVLFPWKFGPVFLRLIYFRATAAILIRGRGEGVEEFVNAPPLLVCTFWSRLFLQNVGSAPQWSAMGTVSCYADR